MYKKQREEREEGVGFNEKEDWKLKAVSSLKIETAPLTAVFFFTTNLTCTHHKLINDSII